MLIALCYSGQLYARPGEDFSWIGKFQAHGQLAETITADSGHSEWKLYLTPEPKTLAGIVITMGVDHTVSYWTYCPNPNSMSPITIVLKRDALGEFTETSQFERDLWTKEKLPGLWSLNDEDKDKEKGVVRRTYIENWPSKLRY